MTQSGRIGFPWIGNFGSIQRNSFTGPGEFKTDMSFFKTFDITERVHAQFENRVLQHIQSPRLRIQRQPDRSWNGNR